MDVNLNSNCQPKLLTNQDEDNLIGQKLLNDLNNCELKLINSEVTKVARKKCSHCKSENIENYEVSIVIGKYDCLCYCLCLRYCQTVNLIDLMLHCYLGLFGVH